MIALPVYSLHTHQIGLHLGCRRSVADFFCDAFCLSKEQEVVRAAGLGVSSAHIESAEGVGADHGACAFAVEVEIADVELFSCAVELFTRV